MNLIFFVKVRKHRVSAEHSYAEGKKLTERKRYRIIDILTLLFIWNEQE